jgi:hypothetical protein
MQVYLATAKAASSKNPIRCPKEPLGLRARSRDTSLTAPRRLTLGGQLLNGLVTFQSQLGQPALSSQQRKAAKTRWRVKVLATVPVVSNGDQGN